MGGGGCVADPEGFRARVLARLRGEAPPEPAHDPGTALGRKRNRNTVRNGQRRRAITEWGWKRTLKDLGERCAYCDGAAERLEKEHFVPLELGGTLEADNIVPACLPCNRRKHDRPPREWLEAEQGPAGVERYERLAEYLKTRGRKRATHGAV